MRERSDIQNLQSLAIHDKSVAELDGDALRVDQIGRSDFRLHFGRERIGDIDDHQAAIAKDVGVGSGDGDPARAV